MLDLAKAQHAQAAAVGVINAVAWESGALDWIGDVGERAAVAFLIAVVSGFGYQLGRVLWQRVAARRGRR